MDSTQGVVLVGGRHAEHCHHGVADELLHRAPVLFDDRPHPVEVARKEVSQRLGIGGFAECRRPGHVAKEDGDDLPLHTERLERQPRGNNNSRVRSKCA